MRTSLSLRSSLTLAAFCAAVGSPVAAQSAVAANVRAVVNELAVMGNTSLTQRSSDALVTGKVKAAMVDAKDLFANAFKVVTERGTTYLMGRVSKREGDRATEIARGTSGVQKVVRIFETVGDEDLKNLLPTPAPGDAKK